MKPMEVRRAELYEQISANATALCRDLGLEADISQHVGCALADMLAELVGGQVISFPKDAHYQNSKREQQILDEHRAGATYLELMDRYRISERGMRRLLQRAQLRSRQHNQQRLFD